MYLFPLLIGIAVTDNVYGDWTVGYFGHVAELVGGRGLAVAVTMAAAVSQVGMFEAEMSSDSYQVLTALNRQMIDFCSEAVEGLHCQNQRVNCEHQTRCQYP
jgi:hypothetical protein